MRKSSILSLVALMLSSIAVQSQSQSTIIEYDSSSKLPEAQYAISEGIWYGAFNVPVLSHDFSGSMGTITFDGVVTTIGNEAFSLCTAAWWIEIPSTVVTIGERAFYDCSNIAEVTIPVATTSIGNYAFFKCSELRIVHSLATTPPSIGSYVFSSCHPELVIYVPSQSLEAYQNAWTTYKDIIYPELSDYKDAANATIDSVATSAKAAINSTTTTQQIKNQAIAQVDAIVDTGKSKISGASTAPEVKDILTQTLADIALVQVKIAAIEEITTAREGIVNTELNKWIDAAITDIQGVGTTTTDEVDRIKNQILPMIIFYKDGIAEGDAAGYARGKAEALGNMAEPCTDCAAVEVTKDDKTVTLYAPDEVSYIKVTE